MKIFIEWDGVHYPHLTINQKVDKETEKMLDVLEEIQGYKSKKYRITKKNLDFFRNKNIKYYTTEQTEKCGQWFNKLAKKIFDYIINGSGDLSFLKNFDEHGNYIED